MSTDGEDWVSLTSDGGVRKRVTVAGVPDGRPQPRPGYELSVHYTGRLKADGPDSAPFDDSRERGAPLKFVLGQGDVIRGWDIAVGTMIIGERAVVECSASYAYGDEGHPPRIPPGADLVFEVELMECRRKKKEIYHMKNEEKIAEAKSAKAAGVELFKQEDWGGAAEQFSQAAFYCDLNGYTKNKEDYGEMPGDLKAIYSSSQLNMSQCALKLADWPGAAKHATLHIKFEEEHGNPSAKALYRRGVARSHLGLVQEALQDLVAAAKLDPKNKAIRDEFARVKKLKAEQTKSQKGVFGSAFEKVDLFPDKPSTSNPSEVDNPYVELDFVLTKKKRRRDDDGQEEQQHVEGGTVVIRVYADACPKTAKNFIALCTGERGLSKATGKRLSYKGCKVHRVVKDFCIQTGDILCNDGQSGESIYGLTFKDEHFKIKHDRPGIVSMANRGPNTNNSQFFITTTDASHCDGKSVAFAIVVKGLDVVKRISELKADDDELPLDYDVVLRHSRRISKEQAEEMIEGEQKEEEAENETTASPDESGRENEDVE